MFPSRHFNFTPPYTLNRSRESRSPRVTPNSPSTYHSFSHLFNLTLWRSVPFQAGWLSMDKSLDTFMTPILLILRILYCSDPTRDPLLSSRWYGAD